MGTPFLIIVSLLSSIAVDIVTAPTDLGCATISSIEYQKLTEKEKRNWARYYVPESAGVYPIAVGSVPSGCTPYASNEIPVILSENGSIEE